MLLAVRSFDTAIMAATPLGNEAAGTLHYPACYLLAIFKGSSLNISFKIRSNQCSPEAPAAGVLADYFC